MCAYSMVNGNFSCTNSYLNNSVLRDEWSGVRKHLELRLARHAGNVW